MRASRRLLPAWMLVAVLGAACDSSRDIAAAPDRPERLEGSWAITFQLERSIQLTLDPARVAAISGRVALAASDGSPVPGLNGPSTHFGAYTADFHPFGFEPRSPGSVPPAAARLVGDSVDLVLGDGDGALRMSGRLAGDSIVGPWRFEGDRAIGVATGRFVMRRSARSTP